MSLHYLVGTEGGKVSLKKSLVYFPIKITFSKFPLLVLMNKGTEIILSL